MVIVIVGGSSWCRGNTLGSHPRDPGFDPRASWKWHRPHFLLSPKPLLTKQLELVPDVSRLLWVAFREVIGYCNIPNVNNKRKSKLTNQITYQNPRWRGHQTIILPNSTTSPFLPSFTSKEAPLPHSSNSRMDSTFTFMCWIPAPTMPVHGSLWTTVNISLLINNYIKLDFLSILYLRNSSRLDNFKLIEFTILRARWMSLPD